MKITSKTLDPLRSILKSEWIKSAATKGLCMYTLPDRNFYTDEEIQKSLKFFDENGLITYKPVEANFKQWRTLFLTEQDLKTLRDILSKVAEPEARPTLQRPDKSDYDLREYLSEHTASQAPTRPAARASRGIAVPTM